MRILLTDDDALLRDMYAVKFKEHGHDVSVVDTGERALEQLEDQSFDVVIFDMVMPSLTGIELFEKIKALELSPRPKCIILSNQGEQADIERAQAAGIDGYLVKASLIPSEVVEKVEEIAEK